MSCSSSVDHSEPILPPLTFKLIEMSVFSSRNVLLAYYLSPVHAFHKLISLEVQLQFCKKQALQNPATIVSLLQEEGKTAILDEYREALLLSWFKQNVRRNKGIYSQSTQSFFTPSERAQICYLKCKLCSEICRAVIKSNFSLKTGN